MPTMGIFVVSSSPSFGTESCRFCTSLSRTLTKQVNGIVSVPIGLSFGEAIGSAVLFLRKNWSVAHERAGWPARAVHGR